MPETNAPADSGETSESTEQPVETGGETKDWQAEATKWQALARKNEERAKANAKAAAELEQVRLQSMTETEKAVAQARNEGRLEALTEVGGRLAAAEIRVAAAGRLSDEQLDALLEVTNLAVFISETGDVDRTKVQRFVDGIAPMPAETETRHGFADLGQGARGGKANAPLNSDPLLRDIKAKLGI